MTRGGPSDEKNGEWGLARMLKKMERLLPHAAILICNMYVVLFLIDRVNPAMNFIDNGLTKGLLAALCVIALLNAVRLRARSASYRPERRDARVSDYAAAGRSARPDARYAYDRQDGYRRAYAGARADYGRSGGYSRAGGYDERAGYERRGVRYDERPRYSGSVSDRRDGYARRDTPYEREGARR